MRFYRFGQSENFVHDCVQINSLLKNNENEQIESGNSDKRSQIGKAWQTVGDKESFIGEFGLQDAEKDIQNFDNHLAEVKTVWKYFFSNLWIIQLFITPIIQNIYKIKGGVHSNPIFVVFLETNDSKWNVWCMKVFMLWGFLTSI